MSATPAPLRVPTWRIRTLRRLVNALFALLTRRQVEGIEHVPVSGGCMLVFNHLSNLDPPLIFSVLPHNKVTGLVAADYRQKPVERFFLEQAGGMWIRRGAGDREALTDALTLLEQGWMVGIAPEGGRSKSHAMNPGKRGTAFLAHQANVPVVPVGVAGTEEIFASLKRLRRPRLTLRFGKPFRLPPLAPGQHKQQLEAHTGLIMAEVAALVPPRYRGVYADHPRLGEPMAAAAPAAT